MKKFSIALLALAACVFILGLIFGHGGRSTYVRTKTVTDTVRDTIRDSVPVFVSEQVVRHDTAWLERATEANAKEVVPASSDSTKDSVRVIIPITQKVYADSTYRAWVSGYNPRLDSIEVYRRTITITTTQTVNRNKRFTWGVTGGVGYGVINRKPDVFIGIGGCLNL